MDTIPLKQETKEMFERSTSNMMAKTPFSVLLEVDLVLNNILLFCPSSTLQNVICTCSCLYKFVINKEFLIGMIKESWEYGGYIPEDWNSSVETLTLDTIKEHLFYNGPRLSITKMGVIHMDNNYWIKTATNQSRFGHVAELRHVCWVHITGEKHLLPGRYRIRWRYRLNRQAYIEHWIFEFITPEAEKGTSISFTWNQNDLFGVRHSEWNYLDIGTIDIRAPTKVDIRIHNHTGQWKRGISLDHIFFERI